MNEMKGAIFDMDGTLLDSMHIWRTKGEDYLRARGLEPRAGANEATQYMSMAQIAAYFRKEYGVRDSERQIIDDLNRMVEEQYFHAVLAKEGAPEALERLARRGVRMCVATATDLPLVEAALRRTGLLPYFSAVFTCTGVGAGKDRPDIYCRAREHLGTAMSETAVFEDALYAVKTAKRAGFYVAGVYDYWEREKWDEIQAVADICIHSFSELERIWE